MPPDILNSREDAVLLWAVVLMVVFVGHPFFKDPRGIGSSTWEAVRALLAPKLLLLFGSAAAYSAAIVLLADRFGLWHTTSLKETVDWFLGSGVILVAKAVDATPSWAYVRAILRRAIALTILITFVANFYVLPLGYEIVLVFLVLVLTLTREVVPYTAGVAARHGHDHRRAAHLARPPPARDVLGPSGAFDPVGLGVEPRLAKLAGRLTQNR
jgi:hypothetical protein